MAILKVVAYCAKCKSPLRECTIQDTTHYPNIEVKIMVEPCGKCGLETYNDGYYEGIEERYGVSS